MFALLSAAMSIVLVDLLLSGDNALVIGTAAAALPRRQRLIAILFGGFAAIVLRIGFSLISTVVLNLPWVQTIGGIILLIIAVRLLADRAAETHETHERERKTNQSMWMAILTILFADLTMSLDNILAVGAIANGNLLLLTIGVLLSVALLLVSSVIIAELVTRLSWLIDIAAFVLAWTAGNMIHDDLKQNVAYFAQLHWSPLVLPVIAIAIVLLADILLRIRNHRMHKA